MVIETERLLLRRPTPDDAAALLAIHQQPEVARFMGETDAQQVAEWLQRNEHDWEELHYGRLTLVERASERVVGRSGLKFWSQFGETEVGWMLSPDVWGRGFAGEAAQACLDWGFRDLALPYITAMIQPVNTRSVRVAEGVGMTPMRRDVLFDFDVVVYAARR